MNRVLIASTLLLSFYLAAGNDRAAIAGPGKNSWINRAIKSQQQQQPEPAAPKQQKGSSSDSGGGRDEDAAEETGGGGFEIASATGGGGMDETAMRTTVAGVKAPNRD